MLDPPAAVDAGVNLKPAPKRLVFVDYCPKRDGPPAVALVDKLPNSPPVVLREGLAGSVAVASLHSLLVSSDLASFSVFTSVFKAELSYSFPLPVLTS